jgi:hypothetical protein
MKKLLLAATLAVASQYAFAHNCPNEWKAIDAAMPATKVDAAKKAEAQKLRDEGEKLHKEGKHADSMAALSKAKGILGIK